MSEQKAWEAFNQAQKEEDYLWGVIDQVLQSTPNRQEAESIVLKKYAHQMDEAISKSRSTFDNWLAELKRLAMNSD